MKVGLITDTHWGVRGDSREFLDHMKNFYRKVFWPEMKSRNIRTICHLGDIVDRRKYINFVTLNALKKEFIEVAEFNDIKLNIIVGNHDIPFRNTNSINAIKETCSRYKNIRLFENPEEIEIESAKILMMPWINPSNQEECFKIMKNTKAEIMFGHLEIKGFEMYRGLPSHDGYDPELFNKFDIVASGHYHKKSTSGNIHYLGAPYEMTWSDYNCPRGFHIFDTETRELEYIRNPFHMFHKIVYDDTDDVFRNNIISRDFSYMASTYVKVIVRKKNDPLLFDRIVDSIYKVGPIDVSIVEDHRNIDSISEDELMDETEDTLTILTNYVGGLETRVNKNDLDSLLKSLYHEAIDLDTVTEAN